MRNLNIIYILLVSLFFLSSCTDNSCPACPACPACPQNENGSLSNLNYWGCDGCYGGSDIVFYTTYIPYPEAFGSDEWEETIYCNEINWFQFEGYLNYRSVSDPTVFQSYLTAGASNVFWEE